MIYFTSDTHYGHKNIIDYCTRPFFDVEHMNRVMVERWNAVVGPRDLVYHLGDFAFGLKPLVTDIVKKLNGTCILVKGNHDKSVQGMLDCGFHEVVPELKLKLEGKNLYLRHIPPEYNEPLPEGTELVLNGHVHEKWKVKTWAARVPMINVGVDQWDFRPVTLEKLMTALGS